MANSDKVKIEQNASRITEWLAEHRAEFEQQGIVERALAGAVGLAEKEVADAVDHLENHEAVVRFPHASSTPPSIVLKPGRGWHDLLEQENKGQEAASR